jgi:hypothetical protein
MICCIRLYVLYFCDLLHIVFSLSLTCGSMVCMVIYMYACMYVCRNVRLITRNDELRALWGRWRNFIRKNYITVRTKRLKETTQKSSRGSNKVQYFLNEFRSLSLAWASSTKQWYTAVPSIQTIMEIRIRQMIEMSWDSVASGFVSYKFLLF